MSISFQSTSASTGSRSDSKVRLMHGPGAPPHGVPIGLHHHQQQQHQQQQQQGFLGGIFQKRERKLSRTEDIVIGGGGGGGSAAIVAPYGRSTEV